jgi:hypothetical protein
MKLQLNRILDLGNGKMTTVMLYRAIFFSLGALAALAVFSFYVTPHYEKGVSVAMEVLKDFVFFAVGGKVGMALPQAGERPKPEEKAEPETAKS